MFLETEASPENLKRNEKDPKKKPNTSKTQIKTSKIDPNNKQFLDNFLNSFGPQTDSQNCSKTETNYYPFFFWLLNFRFSQTQNFHTNKVPF